jgi:hypothetical protein
MTAVEKLEALGYAGSIAVNERKGVVTVRIRTTRGWTYEKFNVASAEAEVAAWAIHHSPE